MDPTDRTPPARRGDAEGHARGAVVPGADAARTSDDERETDRAVLADPARLAVLKRTGLPDAPDEHLDRWAQVAAEALGVPVARFSLVDEHRQNFQSMVGLEGWAAEAGGTALAHSLCRHVVARGDVLVMADARAEPVHRWNPAITDLGVVAYAGAPVVVEGRTIGALCAIDHVPRAWADDEVRLLTKLGDGLGNVLQLRLAVSELARGAELAEIQNRIYELIAEDRPVPEVLDAVVAAIETHDPGLQATVLLLDPVRGTLGHAAPGRRPHPPRLTVDDVPVGPTVGSCGAAAATGLEVLTHDLREDERWDDWRHLTEPLGLRHCWSLPMVAGDGVVLGTLALYGAEPRSPDDRELRFLRGAARLAGIAVERRRARDRLVHDATHDPMTGSANRSLAYERLDALVAEPGRGPVSALFVDLDRLKVVNDSLGRDTGDRVVQEAAERLRACAGPDGLVARTGGEEFLLVGTDGPDRAATRATEVVEALRRPLLGIAGGQEIVVTASVGIALAGDAWRDAHDLVRRADAAMYTAKADGGDGYAWSDAADLETSTRRLTIENGLRHAVARGELSLVHQPLREFATGRVTGVECLLRWTHPELGAVGPDEFIPIAERTGAIRELGAWVLRTACTELPALETAYHRDLAISVNVSGQQLRDPTFAALVVATLSAHGLAPERLYLELTETALLGYDETTMKTVRGLHDLGCRMAVDDFGTGYSSLAVLKRYPIRAIKIDRTFVDGIPADAAGDLAIVTALVPHGPQPRHARRRRGHRDAGAVRRARRARLRRRPGLPDRPPGAGAGAGRAGVTRGGGRCAPRRRRAQVVLLAAPVRASTYETLVSVDRCPARSRRGALAARRRTVAARATA